jgi:tripartite-type tricarboxylate transporter receptor subunit TctC
MDLARCLRAFFGMALGALMVVASGPVAAQSDEAAGYPNKIIRIVVGFAAGGGNDIFARLVGQSLQQFIGQSVVIENRPGAGGRLASEYVATQPADGYTLLVGASGAMSIAAAIYPKLPYHPTRSFVPLAMIGKFPLILVVPVNHPAKTVQELVAWAKANPDKTNYATTSPAFTITTELLKLKTGMPGVAISYKSSNEMLTSVVAGNSTFAIVDGPPAVPMVTGGQVRALAVTGSERSAELPDVPSMAEAGLPEVNIHLWSGVFAPAGTPPAIAKKLAAALQRAIRSPDVAEKLKGMAVVPGGGPSDEFVRMIDADVRTYVDVVKSANLTFVE